MSAVDDAAVDCAMAGGAMNAAEWSDFFALAPDAQIAVASTYRSAVFASGGESAWQAVLGVLAAAASVAGAATGITGAYQALKGLA